MMHVSTKKYSLLFRVLGFRVFLQLVDVWYVSEATKHRGYPLDESRNLSAI
jgi:hypothetical protein